MAKVHYDQFAGLHRLADAARTIDHRAAVILTYHAALEREMDVVLEWLLPRADRLKRFGFGHKLDVLAAAWRGAPQAADALSNALMRFNDLRNAVAHGDRAELVDQALARLLDAYRVIAPNADDRIEVDAMVAGICGFMADRPPGEARKQLFIGLGKLVDEAMPTVAKAPAPRDGQS